MKLLAAGIWKKVSFLFLCFSNFYLRDYGWDKYFLQINLIVTMKTGQKMVKKNTPDWNVFQNNHNGINMVDLRDEEIFG